MRQRAPGSVGEKLVSQPAHYGGNNNGMCVSVVQDPAPKGRSPDGLKSRAYPFFRKLRKSGPPGNRAHPGWSARREPGIPKLRALNLRLWRRSNSIGSCTDLRSFARL
jgi:hypothetical protein